MVSLNDKLKTVVVLARYFIVNGIFATAIYFGMFVENFGGTNIEGAENLALFIAWVTGILGTIVAAAFAIEKSKGTSEYTDTVARLPSSPVPFWFDLIFDLCVIVALVWTGHYVLVFFYIASIHAGKELRDIPKNMVLNKLKSQQL